MVKFNTFSIIAESHLLIYEKKQFEHKQSEVFCKNRSKFIKINEIILKNRESNSFWMIISFNNNRFDAMYLSKTDTMFFILNKDSVQQLFENDELIEDYAYISNKIINKAKLPNAEISCSSTTYFAFKIDTEKKSIVRNGFNVLNYSLIKKF